MNKDKQSLMKNVFCNVSYIKAKIGKPKIPFGITLLELMITLAIVAILLTAVGPNIQGILISNRITASINDISSVIRFARNTAINEQTTVTICPSNNFTTCNNNWSLPKIVFIDTDNDGSINGNEERLATSDRLPDTLNIRGLEGTLTFADDGSTAAAQTITICHNNDDNTFARALLITQFGRVNISVDDDDDGIAEDLNGNALSCI